MDVLTAIAPLVPPTAAQSAAQKVGDTVNVGGVIATVRSLFQSTLKQVDNAGPTAWHSGDVRFGYVATSEYNSLLVRWDKGGSSFLHGKKVLPKDFSTIFSAISRAP